MHIRRRISLFALAVFVVCLPAGIACASDLRYEAGGVRAAALGGAYRAVGMEAEAIFYNPAGMAQFPMFQLSTGGEMDTANDLRLTSIQVMDSASGSVAATLTYTYFQRDGEPAEGGANISGHIARLGIGFAITPGFTIGGDIKYLYFSRPGSDLSKVTFDAGIMYKSPFGLAVAITGHNLYHVDHDLAAPRSLGLGVAYSLFRQWGASFDTVFDFDSQPSVKNSYHWGVEYYLQQAIALRTGFELSFVESERYYYTFGLGYVSQMFSVEGAYRQALNVDKEGVFSLGFKLLMN